MSPIIRNERGVFFPAVVVLLIVVSIFLLTITAAYESKYQTYDALELYYERTVIEEMELFHRQNMR